MNDFTSVRIHFTPDPVTCEGNSNEDIKGCLADVEKSLKKDFLCSFDTLQAGFPP